MDKLSVTPVPVVASLKPYCPGRLPAEIDLFLDANEAPETPADLLNITDALDGAGFNRYPSATQLEADLARSFGIDPGGVLVTAGADDALERAIRSVCTRGRNAILTKPSFVMLNRYVRLTGAELSEIEWWSGDWPVEQAIASADSSTSLVAVVSPNNPTGSVISEDGLRRLARALPQALILFDHAYAEFADEDLTKAALSLPNVIAFRTISKARGCAGLRVGWVMGEPGVIAWLRSVGQPYSVSAPSLAMATELFDRSPAPQTAFVDEVRIERERLSCLLQEFGAEVLPSQGNFVLVKVADSRALRKDMASLGIAVRAFSGDPLLDDWVRITLPGSSKLFRRLSAALRSVFAPEAVLFDMDGVLADVSNSYRAAIVETAAVYGVGLSADDVRRAKAEGNGNNDWELTRRLLLERNVDIALEEVVETFERFYQGDQEQPGLRATERLTLDRQCLRRLADRYSLAVVTGRPRLDAERFLNENDLGDLFDAVVCMEDAPAKPDPGPVALAVSRLGVGSAWMLGDTVDDVHSARSCGVLPIGVVAPGENPTTARRDLENAGAARVLDRADQILEVLPC